MRERKNYCRRSISFKESDNKGTRRWERSKIETKRARKCKSSTTSLGNSGTRTSRSVRELSSEQGSPRCRPIHSLLRSLRSHHLLRTVHLQEVGLVPVSRRCRTTLQLRETAYQSSSRLRSSFKMLCWTPILTRGLQGQLGPNRRVQMLPTGALIPKRTVRRKKSPRGILQRRRTKLRKTITTFATKCVGIDSNSSGIAAWNQMMTSLKSRPSSQLSGAMPVRSPVKPKSSLLLRCSLVTFKNSDPRSLTRP